MAFAEFMAEPIGRLIRIIGGLAVSAIGVWVITGWLGLTVAAAGLVFVAAGLLNVCVISPFLHAPFNGREVRRRKQQATS